VQVTTPETGVYPPEALAVLDRVLDESFRTLINAGPVPDEWRDEVRNRLAEVIIVRWDRGERDPLTLSRTAVAIVGPTYTVMNRKDA
jgi:hypothetical protein